MTRWLAGLLAVVALSAVGLAAPAEAAPQGACVWGVLDKAHQGRLVQKYREMGLGSLGALEMTPLIEANLMAQCKVPASEGVKAGVVLGTMIVETGADAVLFEQAQVPRGTLAALWNRMPEADKEALRGFGLRAMADTAQRDDPAYAIIERATNSLNLPTAHREQVFNYLFCRAIRDALEAGRTY